MGHLYGFGLVVSVVLVQMLVFPSATMAKVMDLLELCRTWQLY